MWQSKTCRSCLLGAAAAQGQGEDIRSTAIATLDELSRDIHVRMLMWQNEDYRACLLAGMVPNEAVSVRSAAFDALRTLSCAKELKRFIWQSEFISAFLFTGAAEGQPVAVRVVVALPI